MVVVETGVDPVTFRFSDANRRIGMAYVGPCRIIRILPGQRLYIDMRRYETARFERGIFAGRAGFSRDGAAPIGGHRGLDLGSKGTPQIRPIGLSPAANAAKHRRRSWRPTREAPRRAGGAAVG